MSFLSQRNRQKLSDDGYSYVFDKCSSDGEIKFWRCERKKEGCKARLHTDITGSAIVKHVGQHSHDASAAGIEVQIVADIIKKRAVETQETTAQVLTASVTTLSEAAQAQLPNISAKKRLVRRARVQNAAAPANPIALQDLVIPLQWTQYEQSPENFVRFLLADSGPGCNRILIFGTEDFANVMEQSTYCYGDGTFRIASPMFSQIYTILVATKGAVLPVLYCLLPDKLETTYARMFELIKTIRPNVNPRKFSCDFEKAAMNAAERAFPMCELMGCFFRLVKNLKKKGASEGLLVRYNNDADFALLARMISSLAFVAVADLDVKFDELSALLPPELQPVLSYFEDTYVLTYRGDGPPQKLKRYRLADTRVLTIVRDYANRTAAEYLRGLAHNFEMNQ